MSQLKKKYKKTRIEFKKELTTAVKENKALAMLIIETYTAWQHTRHITKIWAMFRNPSYSDFQRDYSDNLMGKHITGRVDIWRSLHFGGEKDLCNKYKYEIPEVYAMGDALGIAYKHLRN
ncbi:hypothetical protein [Cytobacillus sp. IB215665]|uniref:hypothetical protein n=1 Tax=Cytobacillus sp. IB215665 TaxID=3097357 RepID=UPI002A169B68|nr:hypothetical protein [Cytobacillus sp. IB215665]MDX8367833.1 hypothetical protein [Cytobacillus sp. IB215665]